MAICHMKSHEWKWGLLIGAANFVWLAVSWALGFHGRGIGMIQVTVAMGGFLYFAGYVFALRSLVKSEPEMGFLEGLRSGALMSVIAAICAVVGQVLYFRFLNPGWTDYMVGETRKHFAALGLDETQLAEIAEGAKTTFGFTSYATQAGIGALFQGVLFSAIIMGVLRWMARR